MSTKDNNRNSRGPSLCLMSSHLVLLLAALGIISVAVMSKLPWRKDFIDEEIVTTSMLGHRVSGFLNHVNRLCYRFDSITENGGYIALNGTAPEPSWELQQLGPDIQENAVLLEQMLEQNFLIRDEQGRLYHPDAVKEIHIRKARSSAGQASGGRFARTNDGTTSNLCPLTSDSSDVPEGEASFAEDSIEYKLARLLLCLVLENNENANVPPDTPDGMNKWSTAFDELIRIQHKDPTEIADVIQFSQKDPFWHTTVRSGGGLKKHYDQMYLQMKAKGGGSRRRPQTYDGPGMR
jgi:hypothetical protein